MTLKQKWVQNISIIYGIVIIAAKLCSYQYYGVGYGTALMFGISGAKYMALVACRIAFEYQNEY